MDKMRIKPSLHEMADICIECGILADQMGIGCFACMKGHLVRWGNVPESYSIDWMLYREIVERQREDRHGGETLMNIVDMLGRGGILTCNPKPAECASTPVSRAESYLVMRGVERLNPQGSVGMYYFTRHIDARTFADIQQPFPGIPIEVFALTEVVKWKKWMG